MGTTPKLINRHSNIVGLLTKETSMVLLYEVWRCNKQREEGEVSENIYWACLRTVDGRELHF
jgi:hypothetical protein